MTDILSALSAAFKARDLGTLHTFRRDVVAAADPDLTILWVGYLSVLCFEAREVEWAEMLAGMDGPDHMPVLAAAERILTRLDTAWTAYLALRAQQEGEGV